ncbi:AAA domain-containing protein [Pholiota molesta]|nr:AAA domain-containing protein [Pholiota molesta]
MAHQRRLNQLLSELKPAPESIGTLKLGAITYDVPASLTPSRLARSSHLLDINDPVNVDNLHFILQKYLLGQDVFLVSQPGPYARRLAMTFASIINSEYEYIALHRDVGETELKQGREIRKGGNLVYVDSPAVNAVKHGRLLILEGIEKAERGIMPVLNNLLENREMNLDDGTHIIHPHRYTQLEATTTNEGKLFIPAHKNFRVIAIAAPVPPYPGYPLDPPFRSRFQARFIDPVGASLSFTTATSTSVPLYDKLRDLILSTQYASESRSALEVISKTALPPFPQTALTKLQKLAWAILSRQTEESGLGELGAPSMTSINEEIGLFGYSVASIRRSSDTTAEGLQPVTLTVAAELEFTPTTRFQGLLTCFLQAHALDWDISLIPPALPSTASASTSTLVKVFGQILGYDSEVIHMYKELGGRELIMRRKIEDGGSTTWEPRSSLHLAGLDVIGSTAGSLSRIFQDRERIVAEASAQEINSGELSVAHPSFRVISTASKSLLLKDWLSDEHANMFFPVPSQPMDAAEEADILYATGCQKELVDTLLTFAEKYRQSMSSENVLKNRKLGTRSLVRMARRLALYPHDKDLQSIIQRSFWLKDSNIFKQTPSFHPSPIYRRRDISNIDTSFQCQPRPEGAASHIPHMDYFYDNSLQTGLMRDIAIDLEILGEHIVLLGNQIVDSIQTALGRPREYIQLHRDTTVTQLMFTTSLEGGIINYTDSPLLRAIKYGRVIIIDEADKAPEHVVAIFRSLAGQGEMSLTDGRRVRPSSEREGDIVVHPNFRLILLANRPGYPFLGNHFLQVLGEHFSAHSVSNPDQESERNLIGQLAPDLDKDLKGYENGILNYPYSLRGKHTPLILSAMLEKYFDFDIYKPETIDKLSEILIHHGLEVPSLGLEAAREAAKKKVQDVHFEPKQTDLDQPKEGKHDDKEHHGGNTWAGGTGGRDTAGLGGRGGYKRLYKGGEIKQVSDELKQQVPDHIKEKAREMARQELQRRLEELDMSHSEAKGYGALLSATQAHMASLLDLLEHLAAKEEERVWVKRQIDGELDDSRLTEGLTGESTVYKRRGMEKPEIGRPQIKPKRIKFIFDLSASMYRFQYDGRLQRSMETAVMLMETFDRLSRKEKYVWDSGDGPDITLTDANKPPTELKERWKITEKMYMIPQYAFAGDFTVESIVKGVNEVAKYDADDWFVIAITDANFGRYQISSEDLTRAMKHNPKVNTALICIGEGAEASWVTKSLPGRAFRVANTGDIPNVLRSILSTMVDR